jgi:hypothetical protein
LHDRITQFGYNAWVETLFVVVHFAARVVIAPVVRRYGAERPRNIIVLRSMYSRALAASSGGEKECAAREERGYV